MTAECQLKRSIVFLGDLSSGSGGGGTFNRGTRGGSVVKTSAFPNTQFSFPQL